MSRISKLAIAAGIVMLSGALASGQEFSPENRQNLRISVVDVEGGAATLFLTPEGKSLLIDAGWPAGRGGGRARNNSIGSTAPVSSSADRIAAAAASLGIKKIDYLIMTHYHVDHLGGLESLLEKIPVDTFVDHGPNRELFPYKVTQAAIAPTVFYPKWTAAYAGHNHLTMNAGQHLKIGSLDIEFVASDGAIIPEAAGGAGQPNALCAGVWQIGDTGGEENVRSLGMLITFGKTRILDLGDLTWNKELELLCPTNRIGKVDVYFVTGHGMDISGSPPTAALDPLVAVMQNGPTKGGDEPVLKTIRTFKDLKGLWQAHAFTRNPELNGDPNYIANLDQQPDQAYAIAMEITPTGEIKVTNTRNEFSKSYRARAAQDQANR